MKNFLKKTALFYTIGVLWVLLLILLMFIYDYVKIGYVWHSTAENTIKACLIGGLPLGLATYLLYLAFRD